MFSWNWAELIISFLGFISAIGATILSKKLLDIIQVNKIIKRLHKELSCEIDDDYINGEDNLKSVDDLSFRLLYFPYIEGLRITNKIEKLSNKEWYSDLISLIVETDELNEWVKMKTELYMLHNSECDDEQMNNKDVEQYVDLCNMIRKRYKNVMNIAFRLKNSTGKDSK